jgi:hypothetical protein
MQIIERRGGVRICQRSRDLRLPTLDGIPKLVVDNSQVRYLDDNFTASGG